jgi:hypothetical protein
VARIADTYDPRTRPWYEGALANDHLFWTGIYIFFSRRVPGITALAKYLDRLVHNAHRLDLAGDSLRRRRSRSTVGPQRENAFNSASLPPWNWNRACRFARDSALEEERFEPSVPLGRGKTGKVERGRLGTDNRRSIETHNQAGRSRAM